MLQLFCANLNCRWHLERRGGNFYFRNGQMLCQDCYHERPVMNPGKDLWSFETTHLDPNRPTQVKSLSHLRSLEKQYGVSSVVANMDSKNWADPPRRGR